NPLMALLGARRCAGYFLPGQFCPDSKLFLSYADRLPEIWRHLRLLEFLGIPVHGDELEFPVREQDRQTLKIIDGAAGLQPGGYVGTHRGAWAVERHWPADNFAAVADALAAMGLRVVLTGSERETSLTRAVATAMKADSLDLAGQTNLGTLAALLEGAA